VQQIRMFTTTALLPPLHAHGGVEPPPRMRTGTDR
jgi:hypothetical protein